MKLIIFILSFITLPIFGSVEVIPLNRGEEIVHYQPLTSLENNIFGISDYRNLIDRHPLIMSLDFEGLRDPVVQHEFPIHNHLIESLHSRLAGQEGLERFVTLVSMIREQERFIRILNFRQETVQARHIFRRENAFSIIPTPLAGLRRAREESTDSDYRDTSPTVILQQSALSESSSEFSYISLTDSSSSSSPSLAYSDYG
ncbi:MAG: hypothetical protein NTZ68_03570 [Candidatus Dependentiae bacterium]|nr:hypothetical protein [Candidatus Dependentiae bacterium]